MSIQEKIEDENVKSKEQSKLDLAERKFTTFRYNLTQKIDNAIFS